MKLGMGLGLVRKAAVVAGGPDANTLFLCRFSTATPTDEVDSSSGTLVGNASCDTANKELVLDGTGDWVTFAGGSKFDVTTNWTAEFHTNCAAAQLGGLFSRDAAGATRYVFFNSGNGAGAFYQTGSLTGPTSFDGSWHHYAAVQDGATWRIYKDGVQESTGSGTAPTASNGTFYIGTDVFDTTGRDMACRIARLKLSKICRYPNGTSFTPPVRTAL